VDSHSLLSGDLLGSDIAEESLLSKRFMYRYVLQPLVNDPSFGSRPLTYGFQDLDARGEKITDADNAAI
jgi:hypothetical protein